MGTIQIIEEIPKLARDIAEWCMQVVHYIACSDRVINHSEKAILTDLSVKFGVDVPSEETVTLESPPIMNEEEKEYILRLIYLITWIDGEFCEAERKNVQNCLKLLNVGADRAASADQVIRKTIFVASVVGAIEEIVKSSPIYNQLKHSLNLTEDDAMKSLRDWRRTV